MERWKSNDNTFSDMLFGTNHIVSQEKIMKLSWHIYAALNDWICHVNASVNE